MTGAERRQAVLWGGTGHAKVLRECLRHQGIDVVAVFDNNAAVPSPFSDVAIHHGREGFARWRAAWSGDLPGFLAAIGGERGRDRLEIQDWLKAQGLAPLVARHPSAFIAEDVRIAEGAQVLAHATICVEVSLGRAAIVNTAASVDHECRLGDGVHVSPGAHLAGCVDVGPTATIGTGASVLPRIRIGEGAVVGAGAVVVRDVGDYEVVVGNPARRVGSRPRPSRGAMA